MNVAHVEITGGDYSTSGKGSKQIKEELRQLGVTPETIRRAIVAVYEAEMNVAIHAYKGHLHATMTPEILEVVIRDTGPGIPDIEQALREGFSTAPWEAREQGFGAGMGLPNIRRNTDRLTIESTTGKGTTLRFSVYLKPETAKRMQATAVTVTPSKCIRCLQCLHTCPTRAIRLRSDGPEIIRHLCIDCTACIAICPQGVFDIDCAAPPPKPHESSMLVLPDALLGQCGSRVPLALIKETLHNAGWEQVLFVGMAEKALADAVLAHVKEKAPDVLSLAPVCPAVLNLIRLQYPSLIAHVVPYLTPVEALRDLLSDVHATFTPSCPAESALLRDAGGSGHVSRLHPREVRKIVCAAAKGSEPPSATSEPGTIFPATVITGMERVCQFLEKAERGLVEDCGLVALYACYQGCFGSPFWDTPPVVARLRAEIPPREDAPLQLHALHRIKPLEPRSGARLDPDMSTAIKKLAQIDQISKQLPGRNCGVCGAPTCLTLAEDIVMDRTSLTSCIYMKPEPSEATKEDPA